MNIRPKTVRRLLILAAAAVVIAGTVGVAFTARRHARETQIAEARSLGLTAYSTRDYPRALEQLNKYILSRPNDVAALYTLGCARMAVETPNREYLFEARLRFGQLLVIEPTHLPASLKLLEVYEQTNQLGEMLTLADKVLARVPSEPTAMRFRAIALTRLNKPAEARKAWAALVALTPDDLNAHSQLLTSMRQDGVAAEDVIAYAQSIVDQHPSDARFQIPLATAYRDAGDEAKSLAVLKSLAAKPPAQPEAVLELVSMLDRARAFDDAQRVLERAADSFKSSMLSAALVQRLWQSGRSDQVISLTDKLLADGRVQPTVLALRALSLASLDRRAEATRLISELAAGDTAAGRAWSEALRVEFSPTPLTPPEKVEALSRAIGRDPGNGIVYTWLARALMQIGETDQAARCYREAAQLLPSWPTPCIELAQAMLDVRRTQDAISAAKTAYLRSPTAAATQVQVARVRFASLEQQFDPQEQKQLLQFVAALRTQFDTEATLLPIHIALLAREGNRAQAQELIRTSLAKKPDAAAIVSLYQVDRQYSLDQADAILRHARDASRLSPQLATLYAADLLSRGKTGDAAALVTLVAQRAETAPDAALAEARIRSMLGDAGAAASWRAVVNRFPNDLSLQTAALDEATTIVNDRTFHAQLIDRVRALTGEDALSWRIEQAKFLAASENPDDTRQAMTIASDLVRQQPLRTDLRVLLGRVLTRLDSRATALEHLRTAYDQAPSDPSIGLELVDAFIQLGRMSDAQAVLKRVAALDITDASIRNRVARVMVDNGMTTELIAMLKRCRERQFLDTAGSLLLAETLWANEQADAAATLFDELTTRDTSPAVLASAAAFKRESGDVAAAGALLERIPAASATPAARYYAVARYHAKFGEIEASRDSFARAIAEPTADANMVRDAISVECAAHSLAGAKKLLDLGQQRFPNHPALARAGVELATMQAGAGTGAVESLIAALSASPDGKPEADALRAVLDARKSGTVTPELATRLVDLANRYPSALELQREAIGACIAVNQSGPAVAIAHRLAGRSAARADMLELSAQTLARFGQWNSARKVAEQWKSLVPQSPREPDLLLAAIAQASGKPAVSLQLSDAYAASFEPRTDLPNIAARAAALVDAGRDGECFTFLNPWIGDDVSVRAIWLNAVLAGGVDQAFARLETVAKLLPADAAVERAAAAAACLNLSERTEDPATTRLGLSLLESPAPAFATEQVRILRAELHRAAGDTASAERELRSLIAEVPKSARARNSLAYLLVSQSRNLDEALQLSNEAALAMPDRASVIDTQARALFAQGDLAGASLRFVEALRLDPSYLDALVGLATVRHQQGNEREAVALITQIDQLLANDRRRYVPAHLRGELRVIRQAVSTLRE